MRLKCHNRVKDGKDHRYWSIVESVRCSRERVVQRHVLYLGELNDSQREGWTHCLDAIDGNGRTRQLALFPADREIPAHAQGIGIQVRLDAMRLERPRQWGACWLFTELWSQLKLDDFWKPLLPDSREGTSWYHIYTSLAVVNGTPAISYYDSTNSNLKFVRASDASGTAWGTPVTLDSTGTVGSYTALAVVNGNPAISYHDNTNGDLKYTSATDANGTMWATPVSLDSTGTVGTYTSLAVVNGNPAVSYYDATNANLKFVAIPEALRWQASDGSVAPLTAATVTAGAIGSAQLATGLTLAGTTTGTFSGSGSGLTNVPGQLLWQTVPGSTQQAQPNTGYMIANSAQVTITLPASPNVGDIIRISGASAGGWKIAQNAGQYVLVGNVAPLSVGVTWTPRDSSRYWGAVASSADGSKLVAGVQSGQIYTSTDSGVTWTPRDSSRLWQAMASSADGSKLVACVQSGQIYTSTDSGVTWTPRDSSRNWGALASSADGSKLAACIDGGQIYPSTDSGVTWSPRDSSRRWTAVASSADGSKLVACVWNGQIYTSESALAFPNSTTTVGTSGYLVGGQGASIELQYVGSNQFIVLTSGGTIFAY